MAFAVPALPADTKPSEPAAVSDAAVEAPPAMHDTASPPPVSFYMPPEPGEPWNAARSQFGMNRPEPVVRSPEQEQINGQAESECREVGDFIRNENVSGLEQCLWDRGYRTMIESALPPGRTVAEQQAINDRAVFQCGARNTECQQEMGYIQLSRGPTPAEAAIEGDIGAAIAVVLGLIGLIVGVWVWLSFSRMAYRFVTKPRE